MNLQRHLVTSGRSLRAGGAALALVTAGGFSACGSSTAPTPTAGGAGNSLTQFNAELAKAKTATFKAVYTETSAGTTTTVTFEQRPPDSLYETSPSGNESGSLIISTASTVTACQLSNAPGAQTTCNVVPESEGLAEISEGSALFEGSEIVSLLEADQSEFAAHVDGFDIQTSSQTFAGQASTCVTLIEVGQHIGKWCVTNVGLLAYEGDGSGAATEFQLTSFTTNVSQSDFAAPSGSSGSSPSAFPSATASPSSSPSASPSASTSASASASSSASPSPTAG